MTFTHPIPEIKITFLGDSGVGKTALLRQFIDGKFAQTPTTLGLDLECKKMKIQNRFVALQLWDTAGQESFGALMHSCYRGSKGVILVYDVTRPKSLENLRQWVEQLNLYVDPSPSMIVVGNKVDLLSATESGQSVEALAQGRNFADSIGAFKHANASAKSGAGVKEVFEDLVSEILFNTHMEEEDSEETRPHTTGLRLDDPGSSRPQQGKAGGCWC